MKSNVWIRSAEGALLLPATLVLAPLASFAACGMAFAVLQQKFSTAIAMLSILLLAVLAGLLGLACLWVALVVPHQKFVHRRGVRIGLACGILLGIADALYWLSAMKRELNSLGPSGWAMWLLMLVGPIIVGAHQFVRLMRLQEAPAEAQSG
jgi:hypothetical protein